MAGGDALALGTLLSDAVNPALRLGETVGEGVADDMEGVPMSVELASG